MQKSGQKSRAQTVAAPNALSFHVDGNKSLRSRQDGIGATMVAEEGVILR